MSLKHSNIFQVSIARILVKFLTTVLLFLCSTVHLTLSFSVLCRELVLYFSTGDVLYFCSLLHFPHCFKTVFFPRFNYVSPLLHTSPPPPPFSFLILFWILYCETCQNCVSNFSTLLCSKFLALTGILLV